MSHRAPVPKKVFESWFAVHLGDRKIGSDWIFWEPHSDRTAWFERKVTFKTGDVLTDTHARARFAVRDWPDLRWCRFRDGPVVHEMTVAGAEETREGATVLAPSGDLLPSYLLPLVAASAPTAPGEALRFSVLWEWERRVEPGHALVSHGPAALEIGGESFATTRYTVEREGKAWRTYWVDAHRRVRKIDYGGPYGILSTRAAASADPDKPL